jgi:hypothetical protein
VARSQNLATGGGLGFFDSAWDWASKTARSIGRYATDKYVSTKAAVCELPSAYFNTATSGEQVDSLVGAINGWGHYWLKPVGGRMNGAPIYGHQEAFDNGTGVGYCTAAAQDAVLFSKGMQGFASLRAAPRLALAGGGTLAVGTTGEVYVAANGAVASGGLYMAMCNANNGGANAPSNGGIPRVGTPKPGTTEVPIKDITPTHPTPRPGKSIPDTASTLSGGYDVSQPIPVLRMPDGKLIAAGGNHRLAAMESLGESTIPAKLSDWASIPDKVKQFYRTKFPDVFCGY